MTQAIIVKKPKLGARGGALAAILISLLLVWGLFHKQIHRGLSLRLLLNSESPRDELFQALAQEVTDPMDFLSRCWATDKVPHRQLVASWLKSNAADNPPWFSAAEPLILQGTVDADMSVRELCFAAMQVRNDPRLFEQAKAQLKDVDPLVRQIGLDYLRTADARLGVPAVIPLLDDPDPRIVARAELALVRWTGQDFGVKVRFALHSPGEDPDGKAQQAEEQKIRDGVALRKQWWAQHAQEYPAGTAPTQRSEAAAAEVVEDFVLQDLQGARVRLSDFRGKVVILNFWASWCTACLQEIPDLAALHREMGDRIAVLGVSLDGLPDEHHHARNSQADAEEQSVGKPLDQIRAKVLRAVKDHSITYAVLLDPTGSVGGRFNGGELPTTVVVDTTGRMRRRFVGERNLAVFKAMVNEAGKSLP